MTKRGAYPGTFSPPTIAHLAIAEAARIQGRLDSIDLVLSESPLGKSAGPGGAHGLPDRLLEVQPLVGGRSWMNVVTTKLTLIADLAAGYDAVILGSDKWLQVIDPSWYGGSIADRDAAVASLPRLLVAPRNDHPLPSSMPVDALVLEIDPALAAVSSSAVRSGRTDWGLEASATTGGPAATLSPMRTDPAAT